MKPKVKLVARRARPGGADWRRVVSDLPIRGLAAVVVVSGPADPGGVRDRLVRALRTAVQPREVPGSVAVVDAPEDAGAASGDVRLLQFEGLPLREPAADALWGWVLGVVLPEAARGSGGLAVDVAAGDHAGNEAVNRWMTAARKGAEA